MKEAYHSVLFPLTAVHFGGMWRVFTTHSRVFADWQLTLSQRELERRRKKTRTQWRKNANDITPGDSKKIKLGKISAERWRNLSEFFMLTKLNIHSHATRGIQNMLKIYEAWNFVCCHFLRPLLFPIISNFLGAVHKFCTRLFWHITYVNRCMLDFGGAVTGKWHVESWHPFISKIEKARLCTLECNLREFCIWNKWRIDWIQAIHSVSV